MKVEKLASDPEVNVYEVGDVLIDFPMKLAVGEDIFKKAVDLEPDYILLTNYIDNHCGDLGSADLESVIYTAEPSKLEISGREEKDVRRVENGDSLIFDSNRKIKVYQKETDAGSKLTAYYFVEEQILFSGDFKVLSREDLSKYDVFTDLVDIKHLEVFPAHNKSYYQ